MPMIFLSFSCSGCQKRWITGQPKPRREQAPWFAQGVLACSSRDSCSQLSEVLLKLPCIINEAVADPSIPLVDGRHTPQETLVYFTRTPSDPDAVYENTRLLQAVGDAIREAEAGSTCRRNIARKDVDDLAGRRERCCSFESQTEQLESVDRAGLAAASLDLQDQIVADDTEQSQQRWNWRGATRRATQSP
jgi:hypothetical protein